MKTSKLRAALAILQGLPLKILLISLFIYLYISNSHNPASAFKGGGQTNVQATIPVKSFLRIFGFTAPNSIVQITGVRTFAQTSSDRSGYFLLDEVGLSAETIEICVITIDSQRRLSFPVCLPTPTSTDVAKQQNIEIGPLLLSPTLSLSKDSIFEKQEGFVLGKTVPDAQVFLSFFEIPTNTLTQLFISRAYLLKQAYAFELYQSTSKSDKNGDFRFTIPTGQAIGLRVFAKAHFNDSPSPKSQTLSFKIIPAKDYFVSTTLPVLIRWFFIFAILAVLIFLEIRTARGRKILIYFSETRLQPFVIRERLQIRRLLYNLRQWWRSNRK